MTDYGQLETEARKPKRLVDHAAKLDLLPTVAETNGAVEQRISAFCESKRISLEALVALDTRVKIDGHGGVELAWGYPTEGRGKPIVSALKYRPASTRRRSATPRTRRRTCSRS